jgi:rRNA maturation endonuclease Nob1
MTKKCLWQENEDGQWETGCDEIFEFVAGKPLENGFNFCPYCGKPIKQKLYKEPKLSYMEAVEK